MLFSIPHVLNTISICRWYIYIHIWWWWWWLLYTYVIIIYMYVCVCVCLWGEAVMFRRNEVYWSFMSFRGHWIIPTDEFWDVGNCWVSPVHREPRGHYCKSYPTTASLKSNEAWLVRSFVTRWVSRLWWGSWSLCGRTHSGLGASGFTHPAYQHHFLINLPFIVDYKL